MSSDSLPVGGFTPGMVLAGRYRIVGLLGRGGMGEVYRADDLTLGQAVALKFLPNSLAGDPVRRERFHAEVRIARGVSHPNICRVYDIGELDGRHFLTMEYIDGEDLASLLKRIGRLPGDKAIDVGRQLCAGLAAAHDKGVLHRDLKPANVMIDGRGRVRITDFGLAMAAGEDVASGDSSGTPAYMAPEQFAGKGASVRSDIYALGLIFYEMYTGRRAFDAATLAELRAQKETATVRAASEIARDVDPIVERVIHRCLEKDPRQRPASVAQVAAALPGGDPLAAAIAAGETPSPEMVAAAGSTEGLRPLAAWACLLAVVLGAWLTAFLAPRNRLYAKMPLEKSPEILRERAREILNNVGYHEAAADSAFGFSVDPSYLAYVQDNDRSASRWNRLADSALYFWYRQSPRILEREAFLPGSLIPRVTAGDPPFYWSGESQVRLDGRGRLLTLRVLPPDKDESPGAAPPVDWSPLFKEAGLEQSAWTPTESTWTSFYYADSRAAWRGVQPGHPEVPMRIEAASYRGRPVYWALIGPWDQPTRTKPVEPSLQLRAANLLSAIVLLAVMVGGAILGRRNLRMGRGDRRGAARLAGAAFGLTGLVWVVSEHHVPTLWELYLLIMFIGWALFVSGLLWVVYISLEPFVRRRWPGALISWSRVLSGSFRDPLVGRDVLIGCVVGTSGMLLTNLVAAASPSFGFAVKPLASAPMAFGFRDAVGIAAFKAIDQPFGCLALLFILFVFRLLLRSTWAAAVFTAVILIAYFALPAQSGPITVAVGLVSTAAVLVLVRFGLLALVAVAYSGTLLVRFPITTDFSAWYLGSGLAGILLLFVLAAYAFHTSLGGQPLFGSMSLEE